MPTYSPSVNDIQRSWHVVDAEGIILGRLASEVANVLRGKHKPIYTPHLDTGDHVIVINADKIMLSTDKAETKPIYRHSGYPGGIRSETFAELMARKPAEAVRGTIAGMIPKNRLGRAQLKKLKVYAGPVHPHGAQNPQPLELDPRAKARA